MNNRLSNLINTSNYESLNAGVGVPGGVGLNKSSDGSSDGAGKLVHLTASRVKAPKRRPPSQAFLKDVVSKRAFLSAFLEYKCLNTMVNSSI